MKRVFETWRNKVTKSAYRSVGKSDDRSLFFQPKLTIDPAKDTYEREADAAADKVMRADDDGMKTENLSANIQGRCTTREGNEPIQQKENQNDKSVIPAIVNEAISSTGHPMDNGTKYFMESRFGYDFSNVKIHTDAVAAKSAESINALAYTTGNNIVFNKGQYSPTNENGKRLLAHELSHVVQQSSAANPYNVIQRKSIREEVPHLDTIGPGGIYEGSVDRYEYENKDAYNQRLAKKRGNAFFYANVKVRFDSSRCILEVPVSVNIVNNDTGMHTHCHSYTEKFKPISKAAFDEAVPRIMSMIPENLNNWFNVHLDNPEVTGCKASNIPIQVLLTQDTVNPDFQIILTANEGRSYVQHEADGSGGLMVLCGAGISETDTIIHESGHMVLGAGDEYRESGKPRSRERHGEYSWMAKDASSRLFRFYERHFQFAPAFMNSVFPGCNASLIGGSRKQKIEITPEVAAGQLSTGDGNEALFISLGVQFGIPLTKMRKLTLHLGPQLGMLFGLDNSKNNQYNIFSLLAGVRAGLKYRNNIGMLPGEVPLGIVADVSGEAGGLFNFADNPGGLPSKSLIPYIEGTGSLGVEMGSQFYIVAEAGKGKMFTGGSNSDIDYYKFGIRFGVGF